MHTTSPLALPTWHQRLRLAVPALGLLVIAAGAQPARAQPGPALRNARPRDNPSNSGPYKPPKPPTKIVGKLTKPLEQYSASQFLALLGSNPWFGWTRDRVCADKANCPAIADSASMEIQAIVTAHRVHVRGAAGSFGTVIGRVRNVGDQTDSTTNIPALEYPDWYYYVVIPNGGARATLKVAVVRYDQNDGSLIDTLVVDSASRGIFACAGHSPRDYPLGDFRSCKMPAPPNTPPSRLISGQAEGLVARRARSPRSARKQLADPDDLMSTADAMPWFSCAEGCCSAQAPPFRLVNLMNGIHAREDRRR